MRRALAIGLLFLALGRIEARTLGYGVDAFNRAVAVSVTNATVFSPLSFEIDSVIFAEAVDPIRRALFTEALHVMDEFAAEYAPLARLPFEHQATNGIALGWVHALIVPDPRRVTPTFRCQVQDLYAVEVCQAKRAFGVEAWVRTRLAGSFDDWRMPPLPQGEFYSLQDVVSVTVEAVPTNGWKRTLPTHFVYGVPLKGGAEFYAVVPKPGRPISSVRTRVTSQTISEITSQAEVVIDPPVPVRLALPATDIVTTNNLTGIFSYFRLPTVALKPLPPAMRPAALTQTVRFRLVSAPAAAAPAADPSVPVERLEGPYVFFVRDPSANTMPVIGVNPGN